MLTAVILTQNEELHIARAIESLEGIADQVFVIDSGSTDRTIEIASELGAIILHNPWRNHATQFNWALDQLPNDTDWVMRLDADEIIGEELRNQIAEALPQLSSDIDGIVIRRRMTFLRRPIRYGGLFPVRILRIFRYGKGRVEDRWMDEHIKVSGLTAELSGELLDDNCNSLTWWTNKHNSYASREVVDLLNLEYAYNNFDTVANIKGGQAAIKRWLKENIYARLPGGGRAFAYFFYRYVLRLGFLDGREGLIFHVLQGFWYRFLVDAKLTEVRQYMNHNGANAPTAIREVLGIDVNH